MKLQKKTIRAWRNRFIFVAVVALGIGFYIWYINSARMYDFSHLTRRMNFGECQEFIPLTGVGEGRVENMVRAVENEFIALYINTGDTTFAIHDKRNDYVWHSSPQDRDPIANAFHQGVMRSNVGFSFYDEGRRRQHRWTYNDAVTHGENQFDITSIPNGLRIVYTLGNLDIGLHFLPRYIEMEYFAERVLEPLADDPREHRFMRQQWRENDEHPGFLRLAEGLFDPMNRLDQQRMLRHFDYLGWTFEETEYHNEQVGYIPEIEFDFFNITFEIAIDRDRLIVNVPIEKITGTMDFNVYAVDVLRFFGAGCMNSEGYLLVPSGSGALIRFNNGKYREVEFSAPVYGVDLLMESFVPQMEQSVRLPVLGIINNGAAMVAHVYSGQGLAVVNADVAAETFGVGGTTAKNNAWFNFTLRQSMQMSMDAIPGGAGTGDLRVVQERTYTGDITIMYHFIPDENPGVGEMAQAYQQFLVEQGVLTPLDGPGDRTFYLDILGAVDVRRHILGTPYNALENMTNLEDAHRFLDMLSDGGVNTVQMQLHGWFNRGVNHDVAKRVNPIRSLGSQRDMQEMEARLMAHGGGLNPVVNFQLTNFYSRNFNRTLEVARDPGGYLGVMSRVARDMMVTRFSIHRNDWFVFVHPAVMPFHVESFLPNYERRMGLQGLALGDMGDIVSESLHRRNPIDREHSRLVTEEQMGIIQDAIPNIVVFGGNDYALRVASHVVDAPTQTDWFHILDYEVPFFSMVLHGFIEHAGTAANMREHFNPVQTILASMTTGASPRYILSAQPTRHAQFSPHERFYSTHYINWMDMAIRHYQIFNDVFHDLRAERIVGFHILAGRTYDIMRSRQVTVTEFSNGTRIYVNNTMYTFENDDVTIPPQWFVVREA